MKYFGNESVKNPAIPNTTEPVVTDNSVEDTKKEIPATEKFTIGDFDAIDAYENYMNAYSDVDMRRELPYLRKKLHIKKNHYLFMKSLKELQKANLKNQY